MGEQISENIGSVIPAITFWILRYAQNDSANLNFTNAKTVLNLWTHWFEV